MAELNKTPGEPDEDTREFTLFEELNIYLSSFFGSEPKTKESAKNKNCGSSFFTATEDKDRETIAEKIKEFYEKKNFKAEIMDSDQEETVKLNISNPKEKYIVLLSQGKSPTATTKPYNLTIYATEKLIYTATPFRMEHLAGKICDFVEDKGHFPVSPSLALPVKRYNYERHERGNIYKVCFGLVDICDELWIFGIGGGALKEYQRAKEQEKQVRSFIKQFDPEWELYRNNPKYHDKYLDLMIDVLAISEDA